MADKTSQIDRILKEHRTCMQVLAEVEECLDGFAEAVRDRELLNRLRTLDGTLRPHFRVEEEGIFSDLPIDHPHLAARFKKLEDEHGTILESLQAAIRLADRVGDDETGQLLKLKAQIQLLSVTVRRHEAEENELVTEAYWNTFGISD